MSTERTTKTYATGNPAKDVRVKQTGSGIFAISGELGKRIFKKYQEAISEYSGDSILSQLYITANGNLKNSNPFIKVLLEPLLEQEGLTLPRFCNLGTALKYFPRELGSHTIDMGFVLRSLDDDYKQNKIIAGNLTDQLKEQTSNLEFPVLVSLRGTKLQLYPGSKYDHLSFMLTDNTEVITAPILNQPGYFILDELDENTCLPKTTRQEKRQGDLELIVGQSGLCRAYINIFGDIDTGTKDLGITDYSAIFAVKK